MDAVVEDIPGPEVPEEQVFEQAEEEPFMEQQSGPGVFEVLLQNGWFIFAIVAVLVFLYYKFKPAIQKWQQKREEDREAAMYHKNPDLLIAREAALEAARKRMQEQYSIASQQHAEKMKVKEEEKRKEKIENYEQNRGTSKGRRLTDPPEAAASVERRKPKFRSDYNPLLGDNSGGSSYRPPRRGGAAGGG